MGTALGLVLLGLCVAASGLYSGSEISFYSLSRAQVELEARQGNTSARIVRWLLRDRAALLVTILIGNNLAIELATLVASDLVRSESMQASTNALLVTLALTPILFLLGEALPKDLFRRRPHALIGTAASFVFVSRIVYWPLERMLRLVSATLERALGIQRGRVSEFRGKELLRRWLEEGRRTGGLAERAAVLAQNALQLRSIPIERVMVPWAKVVRLERGLDQRELFGRVRKSRFSRLPVLDEMGRFLGYVHQLDVLRAGPEEDVLAHLRAMPLMPADTPVDRALLTLRGGGHRAGVVGEAGAPQGLVSLKDLLEEISGDLVDL